MRPREWGKVGVVARIMHWVEIALTRRLGQATTSNLARPGLVTLLRIWLPILASFFGWKGCTLPIWADNSFPVTISVSPRLLLVLSQSFYLNDEQSFPDTVML